MASARPVPGTLAPPRRDAPPWADLLLPGLAVASVVTAAVFSGRAAVPFSALSRDPVTELQGPFYVGWLSYLGAVLWCSAAVACLFAWAVVRRTGRTPTPAAPFLLASGLLSALLLADDLFMLHDGLFPHVLHVGERKTLALYALLLAAYLLRFRRDILATRWAALAAAFTCFALSLAFDVGLLSAGEHRRHMFEDGFKLVGIAWWCTYFVGTSLRVAAGPAAAAVSAPGALPGGGAREEVVQEVVRAIRQPAGPLARLSPGRAAAALAATIALLLVAHTAGQWVKYRRLGGSDAGHYLGMIRRFDLNAEGNVPTWFASALLLGAAALAGCQSLTCGPGQGAQGEPRVRWRRLNPWHWPAHRHWGAVSMLLVLMSLDEAAELHEKSILPLRKLVGASPWLYYPWVVPAAVLVAVVAVSSWRFLASLPSATRRLLLAAAVTYVAGALGMETVGGWYASRHGSANFAYSLLAAAEEVLEMTGAVLFVYAMLDHLRSRASAERSAPNAPC